ncbi:MAG TPA: hypothetical protein VJ111_06120, partial [Chitinophagaceae bacterium]|nr:hypothetical protein [Chitinophagaceae bacterium]
MKKVLSGLSDRARVNCLNALGREYCFQFIHSDSSLKYASMAFHKASEIQYNSGKALSLISQADVYGRLLGQPAVMERLIKQAIESLKN